MAGIGALTHDDAAALIGVSRRRMFQIVRDGEGPPQNTNGRFPLEEFGKWWRARIAEEYGVADNGVAYDLNAERARLAHEQANKTALDVAELKRELIRAEDVTAAWANMVAAARAKMLALPSAVAPRFAEPARLAEAEAALRDGLYEALSELAGDGIPERARARGAGDGGDVEAAAEADGEPVGGPRATPVARVKRRAGKVANRPG